MEPTEPMAIIEYKIEQFGQKLRAQAGLYRTLLGLARKQAEQMTSADNVDALVAILEEKRKVVDEIEGIEASCGPLRRLWEDHRDDVSESTREKMRAVVGEIRALLEELLELEDSSRQKLGLAKDSLEEEIRQLGVGPKAMRSYSKKPDDLPRFMDETG